MSTFFRSRALKLSFFLGLAAGSASAITPSSSWLLSGTGSWSTAANWSGGVPSSTVNATISNGTTSDPTEVDANSIDIATLKLTLGANNLLVVTSGELDTSGTSISNAGSLTLNNGFWRVAGTGTTSLSGGGTVTLENSSSIMQQGSSGTLENVDNLIQGQGEIGGNGMAFTNLGTVNANDGSLGGQILITGTGPGTINNGTFEATNGGRLVLKGDNVNNGGSILADGGTVDLKNGVFVSGGTLTQSGTGVLEVESGSSSTLAGVTVNGVLTIGANATSDLRNSLTNNGTVELQDGASLHIATSTTLSGGGTVTLDGGNSIVNTASGNATFSNTNNLVQGSGVIGTSGLIVSNGGVFNANSSGNTLQFTGGDGITNTNLLEATAGGTLEFSGGTISNGSGTIQADGGTVKFDTGAAISGGTLANSGAAGSWLGTASSKTATLSGVTIDGTYTADTSSNTTLKGTITNTGTLVLNQFAGLGLAANATLSGGGTIVMGPDSQISNAGGTTFTLTNANNLIEGQGEIGVNGLDFTNKGTVDANDGSAGGKILIKNAGSGVINQGILEATGGGTLELSGGSVFNSGSISADGGAVNLTGGVFVSGGTVSQIGTGTLSVESGESAQFDNVTLNGALAVETGAIQYLRDTITNHGSIELQSGASLHLVTPVTMAGGGTVTLDGTNVIDGPVALENVDNLIQGAGEIGSGSLSLTNDSQGTILANNGVLTLDGTGGVKNLGTFEVVGGSKLSVTSSLANFNGDTLSGGTYVVDGTGGLATLVLNLGTNQGKEIIHNSAALVLDGSDANVALIDLNGHAVLSQLEDNRTSQSSLTLEGGYHLTLQHEFSNFGSLTIGTGSELQLGSQSQSGYVQAQGHTVIQAGGTLSAGSVLISGGTLQVDGTLDPLGPITIGPGTMLDGTGSLIGNLDNSGTLILGDSLTSPGQLAELGDFSQSSSATLDESLAKGLNGSLLVAGNVTAGGTLELDLLNGFTPTHDETFDLLFYSGTLTEQNGGFTLAGVADPADWVVQYDVTPTVIPLDELNPSDVLDHAITLEFIGGKAPPTVPEPSAWMDEAFLALLALTGPTWKRRLAAFSRP